MTYPLPSVPSCARPGCGHSETVHLYGVRRGRKVRTACTHGDPTYPTGMCGCAEFVHPDRGNEGGAAA